MKKNKIELFFVHPLLFSIFPVLFLYSHNLAYVHLSDLPVPLLISCTITLSLFTIFWSIFRKIDKAALTTALALVPFYVYNPLYNDLDLHMPSLARHRILLPILFLIFLGIIATLRRTQKPLLNTNKILCLMAIGLVATNTFQIISGTAHLKKLKANSKSIRKATANNQIFDTNPHSKNLLPNIYYIILDGYTNQRVLREHFQFDNTAFLNQMREKGFFIQDNSLANYPWTIYSLASSLNMEYINAPLNGDELHDFQILESKISKNKINQALQKFGYTLIYVNSGHWPTEHIKSADQILYPQGSIKNYFLTSFFDMTILTHVNPKNNNKRNQINRTFELLKDSTKAQEPFFFFCHFISPHDPHVFKPDGSPQDKSTSPRKGYLDDLQYLNQRVLKTMDDIKKNSKIEPIIIVQGDHGWVTTPPEVYCRTPELWKYRFGILNALHLPGKTKDIPHNITPVNTFKFILNEYFGTHFAYLDNKYYLATNPPREKPINITSRVEKFGMPSGKIGSCYRN